MKRILSVFLCIIMALSFAVTVVPDKAEAAGMSVSYAVHVQTYGDSQGWVKDGKPAGTSGEAKRLESIRIKLEGSEYSGSIMYKTHVQTHGWLDWSADGAANGTTGEAKRLEGIMIKLTGDIANYYDVTYRVHAQTYGWMDWVSNGTMAGTSGEAKRLEAIEIKLVPKASEMGVTYRTHVQSYGWLDWSSNGAMNGTSGEAKRLEAIQIKLVGNKYAGGIRYRTHIQSYGWEGTMLSNGASSGTSGEAKRLEAIQIELYGDVANYYDVYYRVHSQTFGWLGWAKNGANSGTSGYAKRLEAIEIRLVRKGANTSEYDNSGDSYKQAVVDPNAAFRNRVVELCNEHRAANGVNNMLVLDTILTAAADVRAKEIVTVFEHTRPDGSQWHTVLGEFNYTCYKAGENIAGGFSTPEAVVEAWMNSPGHRANILNPDYNKIGVGYYVDQNGAYWYYWVQLFSS